MKMDKVEHYAKIVLVARQLGTAQPLISIWLAANRKIFSTGEMLARLGQTLAENKGKGDTENEQE